MFTNGPIKKIKVILTKIMIPTEIVQKMLSHATDTSPKKNRQTDKALSTNSGWAVTSYISFSLHYMSQYHKTHYFQFKLHSSHHDKIFEIDHWIHLQRPLNINKTF